MEHEKQKLMGMVMTSQHQQSREKANLGRVQIVVAENGTERGLGGSLTLRVWRISHLVHLLSSFLQFVFLANQIHKVQQVIFYFLFHLIQLQFFDYHSTTKQSRIEQKITFPGDSGGSGSRRNHRIHKVWYGVHRKRHQTTGREQV